MIAFDSSESSGLSAPTIQALGSAVVLLPWLEERTGADCLVSGLTAPLTPGTLAMHLSGRACLVQIKHGEDLLSSAGYRANESLSHMLAITHVPWQRVLTPVGHFIQGKDDSVLVGTEKAVSDRDKPFILWWKSPRSSWTTYESILRRWVFRGGVVLDCKGDAYLANWLTKLESDLISLPNTHEVYQDSTLEEVDMSHPLQELRVVHDWRCLIAAFPGIGPAKIDALVNTFRERQLTLNGSIALEWALESPLLPTVKVPGWGKQTRINLRQWVGLTDDHQTFHLSSLPDEFVKDVRQAMAENPLQERKEKSNV